MKFAIVDVETSGGISTVDRIVEIGIVLMDNGRVVNRFGSLVNPGISIPVSLTAIHGISNEMVKDAPSFSDLTEQITEMLSDRIFVAHNVHFDYGFLQEEFKRAGQPFSQKKLCTVRLSRKILKLSSHSLANLCKHFSIVNTRAHRALEDAVATADILSRLLILPGTPEIISEMIRGKVGAFKGPENLPEEKLNKLPNSIGVYLFMDAHGKVIYVGKAINLRDRVRQHFTAQTHTKEKRSFLESIHDLDFVECGHELMALMTENELIKKHYPRFNTLNKDFRLNHGIYEFQDQRGFRRLVLGQSGKWTRPLRVFRSREEAFSLLLKLSIKHGLCLKLNGLTQENSPPCSYSNETGNSCLVCNKSGQIEDYNGSVTELIRENFRLGRIVLKTSGRKAEENGAIYLENGKILGFGYVPNNNFISNELDEIRSVLEPYYDTQDAQSIIRPWLEKSRQADSKSALIEVFEVPETLA